MASEVPDTAPPTVTPSSYPDPRLAPWPAFALAAEDAVEYLNARLGLDLWLVTHRDEDRQVVVAAAGHWVDLATPGTDFSWPDSFCLPMSEQRGPSVAPDVLAVPEYASLATGIWARVRAYVGVPLEGRDGKLFGTLCALAGTPQPDEMSDGLDLVRLVARMLSTILSGEQLALERSMDAAAAYALAERDRLTGLYNRRGWETALAKEDQRCRRYGSSASVLVLDLDDLQGTNEVAGPAAGDKRLVECATLLTSVSRPADVQARLGDDEFGVLAVHCDAAAARAMLARLRVQLRTAGVVASAGSATYRVGEDLTDTFRRAEESMYRDKRRRERTRPRTALPP